MVKNIIWKFENLKIQQGYFVYAFLSIWVIIHEVLEYVESFGIYSKKDL